MADKVKDVVEGPNPVSPADPVVQPEPSDTPISDKAAKVAEGEEKGVIVSNQRREVAGAAAPTLHGRTGVVETDEGPVAVVYGVGQYATTPLRQVPDWYLAHLMGDAADVKWHQLTKEQQEAVRDERNRRAGQVPAGIAPPPLPVSDVTSLQELTAKADTLIKLEEEGIARGEADAQARADAEKAAAENQPTDTSTSTAAGPSTFKTAKVTDVGVDDASAVIAKVKTEADLDAIAAAEAAGKNRVGVLTAVEKRRAELKEDE